MDSLTFFELLFGKSKGWLSLWRSDTKSTTWVRPNDQDAIRAFTGAAIEGSFNAYYGVCLQSKKPGKGRGDEAGVGVMTAVWADVDFASKDDAKKTYPTREQAELALTSMPMPPSIVMFTGGGLHAYWLLTKPLKVDDSNRDEAKAAVQSWQRQLRSWLLKKTGATIDSTHDLARVLRIPGTPNVKTADNLIVKIDEAFAVDDPPARYEFSAFVEQSTAAPAKPSKSSKPPEKRVADRVLATPASEPPADRLANMMEADSKFAASWQNQRGDLKSPSEYDLSLATFAHNAGWTDVQIAALLLAFARRFYPDRIEKLLRVNNGQQDYMERTIRAAKRKTFSDQQNDDAREAIDDLVDHVATAREQGVPADRPTVFAHVSKMLGIDVVGFRQTGERDEVYELIVIHHGNRKAVEIGGADKLHASPKRLVERLLATCQHYIAITKDLRAKWGGIVSALISVIEFVEVSESTTESRVRHLIDEHLQRWHGALKVTTKDHRQSAAIEGRPFVDGDELFISGQHLKRLAAEIDRGVAGDLYVGLRAIGFVQKTVQIPARTTSRSFWAVQASAFGLAVEHLDLMNGDGDDESSP